MRFCPTCSYYLYIRSSESVESDVLHECKNCGFTEPLNASEKEILILETNFRSGSSAGGAASGITVNSYTLQDPTNPHVKTIPCPNTSCATQLDPSKRDVIYIKTDPTNLKFQYICTSCKTQWTN
jgi:DNA-directed RNA polymerase subunit M/transcription elongation factor TFIIS